MGILIMLPFTYAFGQNVQSNSLVNVVVSFLPINSHSIVDISSADKITNKLEPTEDVKYIPIKKVRSGFVQDIDYKNNSFTIKNGNTFLKIEPSATTTIYLGEVEEALMSDIYKGRKVYVFGFIKNNDLSMDAYKIVISNKSIF